MTDIEIRRPAKFCEKLLREYLAGGFGRMQKRDIDVLMLHLLLKDGRFKFPNDIYTACRELNLTEARLRNLYQEAQLRHDQISEEDAKSELVDLVRRNAFEVKGNRILFVIRNPMLGQYFQEWVAKVDGFTDSSFNPHLVSVHKDIFVKILKNISEDDIGDFPDDLDQFNDPANKSALMKLFVDELVKSAGSTTGKMAAGGLAKVLALFFGFA